ncbi:hypothetical protein CSAL01_10695 [Colletotrichum salicis]|uniref:Uncharacterized protein n=1 Tax=Colletotrichum salicis TaxID=1209931 RepID=A0A135V0W4_9PEZI|nr:hypothetical protein CSAL01_10695 [Colletotrichum salicis]
MAPSALHSLRSPTITFKPILAAFTQPPTATPTTLLTTVAKLIPRNATNVSVYITQSTSASPAPTDAPKLKDPVYGNLTWTFIVVPCVPVIVLIFFIFTCYQERRRTIKNMERNQDIEMQTFHKYWFPWRELDKNEVPNEVSETNKNMSSSRITSLPLGARDGVVGPGDAATAAASATAGSTPPGIITLEDHSRRRNRPWAAWHPSDGTQIPPITLYENPPSWGRRHLWSEVMAYPSLLTPGLIRRRTKAPKPDPADDTSSSSSYSSPPSPNASPPRLETSPRPAPPRTPGGLPVITESGEGEITTAPNRPRFAEPTTQIIESYQPEPEHGPGRETNQNPTQIYRRTGHRRHYGHEDDHPRENQSSSSSVGQSPTENQTDTSDEANENDSGNEQGNNSDADSITTQKPIRPPTDMPSFGRFKDISSSTATAQKSTTTASSSGTGTWAAGHISSYYGASPSSAQKYIRQPRGQPHPSASASTPTQTAAAAAAGAAALSRRAHASTSRSSAANSDGVSPLPSARSSTVTSIGSEPGFPTRTGSAQWRGHLVFDSDEEEQGQGSSSSKSVRKGGSDNKVGKHSKNVKP